MPDTDGITLLKEWAGSGQLTMPVVMMSGHGTIETAVEATRIGALDYLEKPIALQRLLATVKRALRNQALAAPRQLSMSALGRSAALCRSAEAPGAARADQRPAAAARRARHAARDVRAAARSAGSAVPFRRRTAGRGLHRAARARRGRNPVHRRTCPGSRAASRRIWSSCWRAPTSTRRASCRSRRSTRACWWSGSATIPRWRRGSAS